jgi:hypothetical protein
MPSLSLIAVDQSLARSEVSFRGFYRSMTEEKLNLFKLTPPGRVTKPRTGAAKVMRGELFDCGDLRILTHHPPHDFLTNAFARITFKQSIA